MPSRSHSKVLTRVHAANVTLPDARSHTKDHKPSPAQLIEARKAQEATLAHPLRYAFGEPPPGRSALDKMKKESRT